MQPVTRVDTNQNLPQNNANISSQTNVNHISSLEQMPSPDTKFNIGSPQKVVEVPSAFHSTIPVVDMNDFFIPANKNKFVKELGDALRQVGFVAVMNPGVDMQALDHAYMAIEKFFSLNMDEKMKISSSINNGQRGYVAGETAKNEGKKDYKEFIHVGRELTEEQTKRLGYAENLWPEGMNLKGPLYTLFQALEKHIKPIQQAMALAIEQPESRFVEMTEEGDVLLRCLHYYKNTPEGHQWAGEHTDIDLFTILPKATEKGLQVLNSENTWVDVIVPPNSFIINAGDMLQRMTNGEFKSCRHRVVCQDPTKERFSGVFFVHPRHDDQIGPLAKSIKRTGGKQMFADGTRNEFLFERLTDLGLITDSAIASIVNVVDRMIDCGEDVSTKVLNKLVQLGIATEKQKAFLNKPVNDKIEI